jgi:hypothetical protein
MIRLSLVRNIKNKIDFLARHQDLGGGKDEDFDSVAVDGKVN